MHKLLALLLILPSLAFARAVDTQNAVLEVKDGQNILIQIAKPASADKPTFLFLPGMNRSLLLSEPAAQELIKDGYGVVAFNFSVQPLSQATLDEGQRPAFYADQVSLQTLADEAVRVANHVKLNHGIQRIIPVTLSYTGSISRYLTNFLNVVDSVPMTSMDAFDSKLLFYKNSVLMTGGAFNPIYFRTMMDAAYMQHWVPYVTAVIPAMNLPAGRKSQFIDGYLRLSRAAENFVWKNHGDRVKRTFIIAANEGKTLLRDQVRVLQERFEAGSRETVFLVMESGHIVPAEHPKIYAQILGKMADNDLKPGMTVITPSTGEWKSLTLQQTQAMLENLLSDENGSGNTEGPGLTGTF